MSSPSEPVETTWMSSITSPSPRRMMVPLPNCFSIWASAAARALAFSPSGGMLRLMGAFMEISWKGLWGCMAHRLQLMTGWMLEQEFSQVFLKTTELFRQFALLFADVTRLLARTRCRTARRLAPDPPGPPDGPCAAAF